MKDINKYISKNFNDNIEYIEKYHPSLFSKLVALENAVANHHYKEKYELIYENNSFDVLEKSTQTLLYDAKIELHAKAAAQNIDHTIAHDTFETFNEKNISDEDSLKYESVEPFTHRLYGMGHIINFTQKKSLAKNELKELHKYIFFGVGLGLHILSIHSKIKSKVYLIIEDDLELFKLSLFTLNYKELSKNSTLIFSVFEDNDEFANTATRFLETEYYYNHYIKFFRLLSHSDQKIELFQASILQQAHFGFHHSNLLLQYLQGLDHLKTDSFLDRGIRFEDPIFTKKPFLIVAPGPSLQKQKEWLKSNQNYFTIVALGASLTFLHKEDIKPDIVIQIDAYEKSKVHFSEVIFEFIKDAIYIFSAKVPSVITKRLNKEQLFFFESGTNYKQHSLKPSSPCGGSTSYQLALLFGLKEIYLLGIDLATDRLGQTHVDTHVNSRKVSSDHDTYAHKLYKVEGNFQETVSTLLLFKSSISAINYSTQMLKQTDQKVYNLSDGAKFTDTIPIDPKDISPHIKDGKTELKAKILSICTANSSQGLNDEEIENIKDKLSHTTNMKLLIKEFKDQKFKNSFTYLKKLTEFIDSLSDETLINTYELTKVVDLYFRRIAPYIFDYFNTTDKIKQEDIEHINILLTTHLLEIITYYGDTIYSKLIKVHNE